MKKYKVVSKAGSYTWNTIIECDWFYYSESGVYHLSNSQTGGEWYFPVMHTIIEKIID